MVSPQTNRISNLISYKHFIRPTANRLLGYEKSSPVKRKHLANIEKMLKILALNGPLTTWEMAKIRFATDSEQIRSREKEYRRLLIGRKDRGRKSPGLVDLGIVTIDSKSYKRNPGDRYRLSLYGILYCLDKLHLSKKNQDELAKNYAVLLPKVFGKWNFLKSVAHDHIYSVKWLGKGLYFENSGIIKIQNKTFFELISYLNIKFSSYSEEFNEIILSELISYWFFITLLYFPKLIESKTVNSKRILKLILQKDMELNTWFTNFVKEAKLYYKTRYQTLQSLNVTA